MNKIDELKADIATRQKELDNLISVGREGALARITELKASMDASLKEIELLASTYELTVYGYDKDRSATFIPNEAAFEKEYGYTYSDSEVGSYRKLPAWLSSSDIC